MKAPVRVTVTGAAGQIGYALLFRIASGSMLGEEQPVILQLLDITPAMDALNGVKMELDDCAFPLLAGVTCTDDPEVAFKDSDFALLVGARPRGPGMERKDLLEANAAIFGVQGKAINDVASRDIKVLVVGNPANTNALIAQAAAPEISRGQFTAMTRLDHNRALSQLATKLSVPVTAIKKMTIWGNHSTTQYPDLFHCEVNGKVAAEAVNDQAWLENDFIPTVAKRGAAIIEARGASSAASAANAAIDPDNRLLWRMNSRRLEAEVVRDNLLHICGALDNAMGGPDIPNTQGQTSRRSSIHLRHAHEKLVEFLQIFDGPNVVECYERKKTVQPHQALALANSRLTFTHARSLADELGGLSAENETFVRSAFLRVLSREPTAEESRICDDFLKQQSDWLSKDGPGSAPDPARRARQNLVMTLFNHNDFVTVR